MGASPSAIGHLVSVFILFLKTSYSNVLNSWDLFENYLSYAHSKARALPSHSLYIVLVQAGPDAVSRQQRTAAHSVNKLTPQSLSWIRSASTESRGIPPLQLLGNDEFGPSIEDCDGEPEWDTGYIPEPTTGARIYSRDAVVTIYRYLSSLLEREPLDEHTYTTMPLFEYHETQGNPYRFTCTVYLLPGSPFLQMTGPLCATKADARALACFQACRELYRLRALESRFFPRPRMLGMLEELRQPIIEGKKVEKGHVGSSHDAEPDDPPKTAKAQATLVSGTRFYTKRNAEFWTRTLEAPVGLVYPSVITICSDHDDPNLRFNLGRSLCLFTRLPLPKFEPFEIFVSGQSWVVHLKRCAELAISEEQTDLLLRYTKRLFISVGHTSFKSDPAQIQCLVAPLTTEWNLKYSPEDSTWPFPSVASHLAWEEVKLAVTHEGLMKLRTTSPLLEEDLEDAVLHDRWSVYGPKYEVVRVRPDLSPLSAPTSIDVSSTRTTILVDTDTSHNKREAGCDNYLDYYYDQRGQFDGLEVLEQPMIEVTKLPFRVNRLSPAANRPSEPPQKPDAKCTSYC